MSNIIRIKRRLPDSQVTGLPVLQGGELAFNEINKTLYYGASGASGTEALAIGGEGVFATNTLVGSLTADLQGQITELDSSVGSRITSLSSTVDIQVSALNSRIDFVSSNVDPEALDSLTEVVSAFQQADSDLNGAITALAGAATSNLAAVSATLDSKIDSLSSSVDSEISALDSKVDSLSSSVDAAILAEQTARENGDSALDSKIDSLSASVDSEVSALESSIGSLNGYVNTNFLNLTGGTVTGDLTVTGLISAAGGLEIGGGEGGDAALFVSSGKVGINTETPNEALTVVGNVSATGQVFVAEPVAENAATTKSYVDGKVTSLSASVDAEVSALESSISSEVGTLNTTIQGVSGNLQGQIDFIVSNVDPAALDSLTEIVSSFQLADSDLNGAITALAGAASTNLATVSAALDSKIDSEVEALETTLVSVSSTLDSKIDSEVEALETTLASVSSTLDSKIDSQITSLSSTVDANFVEKVESDAVTLNGGLTVTTDFYVDVATSTFTGDLSGNGTTSTIYGFVFDGGSF
jgi:exonuclease VII small subunit